MAAWRRAIELSLGERDTAKLKSIAHSGRIRRAAGGAGADLALAYREDPRSCGGTSFGTASSDGPAMRRARRWLKAR